MKHLRTYESVEEYKKDDYIGKYVITQIIPLGDGHYSQGYREFDEWCNNNIGQVVGISEYEKLLVKYDNWPKDFSIWFHPIKITIEQIIFSSKDREGCESYLTSKKYNI